MTDRAKDVGAALELREGGKAIGHREASGVALAPSSATVPSVSILVVSYKTRQELQNCLASIEEQDSLRLEVIVVDNASDDGTAEAIRGRFPWVTLVSNSENVGFARAVNQAMELASGEYFLLLNPDTVLTSGALRSILERLSAEPGVGMIGCKLVRPDGSFDHACKRGFPTISTALYYFLGLSRLKPRSPRYAHYTAGSLDPDETGLVDAINGAFMLVRREAVEDVGPMDERFWLYAEDLDWCRRFWERGWKILYWPEAEVIHIKGASSGDHRSPRLNRAFHRSIWLFYLKHHASTHGRLTSSLVYLGIWSKYAFSVVWNSLRAVLMAPISRRSNSDV